MRIRRRDIVPTVLTYAAVVVLVVTTLAPLIWLFIMSISSTPELTAVPLRWIPSHADFSRYGRLLSVAAHSAGEEFIYALRNSLLASFSATAIALVVGIPAAYSFSRFPGRRMGLLYAVLGTYMMPPVALISAALHDLRGAGTPQHGGGAHHRLLHHPDALRRPGC